MKLTHLGPQPDPFVGIFGLLLTYPQSYGYFHIPSKPPYRNYDEDR